MIHGTLYLPGHAGAVQTVVPAPVSGEPLRVEVDGIDRLSATPYRRDPQGRILSYRLAWLEEDGAYKARRVTISDGPPPAGPQLAVTAEVLNLLGGLRARTLGVDGSVASVPLLGHGGKIISTGPAEIVGQWAGKLEPGQLGGGCYVAIGTTWHGEARAQLDLLVHNASWGVPMDWWLRSLELQLPPGWHCDVDAEVYPHAEGLAHVLPMQQGRLVRVSLWHKSTDGPMPILTPTLEADPDGVSWANPALRPYLPQGVPVDWGESFSFPETSVGFGPYRPYGDMEGEADDPTYGGAGSSFEVEPYGYVGLALHGWRDTLERAQSDILDRLPCLLIDHLGRPLDAAAHAEDGALPWNFNLSPSGRGATDGKANPSNLWHPSQDPFGFTASQQHYEKLAAEQGVHCPYLGALLAYAPYDRQHWMRALVATLPLAYICGDLMSVYLLREHAHTARVEFWDGAGDPYTARVGHYHRQAIAHPGAGLSIGREDAWAIQTVLASCELAPALGEIGDWARFGPWIACYGSIIMQAAAPSGLVQAIDNGKELDTWGGEFAVCQAYQEAMLAGAACALAWIWPDLAATALGQARGIDDVHGTWPAYKAPVRELQWGPTLDIERSSELADVSQHIDEFVPAMLVAVLMHHVDDDDARAWAIEWMGAALMVNDLTDWEPGEGQTDRMFASVVPAIRWLERRGLI